MRSKLGIVVVVVVLMATSIVLLARRSLPPNSFGTTVTAEPSTLEVRSGTKASPLSFVVKNQGNIAVEIVEVTASCGCTVVKVPRRKLNPQEAMTVEVQATPPGVGEKTSFITVHTVPPQQLPLNVLVTLKGEKQPAPFVSYCPDSLSLNGSAFGEKVAGQLEVHTIEKTGTSPWIAKEQLSEPTLRIGFDEPPVEEPLDSETVRRIYKLKVAAVLSAESESPTVRYRHVIATLSKGTAPDQSIAIECRVVPLVKAAPSVLNLTIAKGASEPVERTVVVIDDRDARPSQAVRTSVDGDWLRVEAGKVDLQEQRSIHAFKIVLDPRKLLEKSSESVLRSEATFWMDEGESVSVRVPIVVRTE